MAKPSALLTIKLSVLEQDEHHLIFSYTASNVSGREAYVFNVLPPAKKGESPAIDPERVYTQIDGTTLVASKRLVEVPKGVHPLAPEIPFLTPLAPGENLVERITLQLPVHEDIPYKKRVAISSSERLQTCRSLIFILGFLTPPEPRWVRRLTIGDRELFATDYGFAIQMNLYAASEATPIAVYCIA